MGGKKATIRTVLLFAIILASLCTGCQIITHIRDMQTGNYVGSISHGGLDRTYRIHIPDSYDGTESVPLLISLHGRGNWGKRIEKLRIKRFTDLSEEEGFIVVYPLGVKREWHDGTEGTNNPLKDIIPPKDIDDVGFLSKLIDHITSAKNIDKQRVYVTGTSNGSIMAHRLACELSEKITAIAVALGTMAETVYSECTPSQPVSVLIIHGTRDPINSWSGGEIRVGPLRFGTVASVPDTIGYWVKHNNCSPTPTVTRLPDKDTTDGTRVRVEVYSQCDGGAEVILYAIEGGGHVWPGGSQYMPELLIGKVSKDIIASQVAWNFLKRYVKE